MERIKIPREYELEQPAFYDEIKFRRFFTAVLSMTTIDRLYSEGHGLLADYFRNKEHYEIALDLFRYVVDIEHTKNTTVIKTRFFAALYEGGFFG